MNITINNYLNRSLLKYAICGRSKILPRGNTFISKNNDSIAYTKARKNVKILTYFILLRVGIVLFVFGV